MEKEKQQEIEERQIREGSSRKSEERSLTISQSYLRVC